MVVVVPNWALPSDVVVGLCAFAKDQGYHGEEVEPVIDAVHDHVCRLGVAPLIVLSLAKNMGEDCM